MRRTGAEPKALAALSLQPRSGGAFFAETIHRQQSHTGQSVWMSGMPITYDFSFLDPDVGCQLSLARDAIARAEELDELIARAEDGPEKQALVTARKGLLDLAYQLTDNVWPGA